MDIYEEYPELRDLKPRRSSSGSKKGPKRKRSGKKGMSNGAKLLLLIVLAAAAIVLLIAVLPALSPKTVFVYNRDGGVMEVKASEADTYLNDGWFASAEDLTPVTLYAEDGSCISAIKGDVPSLEKKGYYADRSAAFTLLYSESGDTVSVPNSMAENYKSKGWYANLGDVTKTLYKTDGSKITVMNADAEKYISEGWIPRLLDAAKKMLSPDGEEKFVFNDDVNEYIGKGWTVIKRVIDPDQPMIALTFDDGPGKYTDKLLNCLEENNSVATFFTLGYLVEAYPEIAKREVTLGCEIGSHTWEHTKLTNLSGAEAAEAVNKAGDKIKEVTGKAISTYRPPEGAYNDTVLEAVELPAIMWSIDTLDWKTRNADATYDKVMQNVKDGDIILMHDIHEPTVEAALRLIPALIEEGYQLVTVSELLEYKKGGAEAGKVYFDAR